MRALHTMVILGPSLKVARDFAELHLKGGGDRTSIGFRIGDLDIVVASNVDHLRGREFTALVLLPGARVEVAAVAQQRQMRVVGR